MKRLLTAAAAVATLFAGSGAAFGASAQDYRHDQRDIRQDHQDIRQDRHDLRQDQRQANRHWNRGERLDNRYGNYAEVSDWRAHRLAAPRRGYHWVRSGDDYVLAAITTGLIASAIAANR